MSDPNINMNQALEEIEALLSRIQSRSPDPNDVQTATKLALDCHRQMLDHGEANKAAAIPFALAGARLLRAVLELGEPQADWVGVHEEQCCRYGGLWIHALLPSREAMAPTWCQEGLELLERLKAINPEARPWAPSLQDDLRAAIAVETRKDHRPTIAAIVNYYDDQDMLRWQWEEGFLDGYDRIYIWDGPYGFMKGLSLFPGSEERLEHTPLGASIMADSRVVYHYASWNDEAEKRIHAYAAVEEDVIALHDSDEFSQVNRVWLRGFWRSVSAVACHLIENIYAGGAASCSGEYSSQRPQDLPRRWGVFKRLAIPPERHIDYLWLVGVEQQPLNQSLLYPDPFCHTYHLTGCRSRRGQANKIAFYKALALRDHPHPPDITRLHHLVQTDQLTLEQAQQIFLCGDVGYAGIPHPDSGFWLKHRLANPDFPEPLMTRILEQTNRIDFGEHLLLNGYPFYVWLPAEPTAQALTCELEHPSRLEWACWRWLDGQPPNLQWQRMETGNKLTAHLDLPAELSGKLIGHLVMIRASCLDAQADWQRLELSPL